MGFFFVFNCFGVKILYFKNDNGISSFSPISKRVFILFSISLTWIFRNVAAEKIETFVLTEVIDLSRNMKFLLCGWGRFMDFISHSGFVWRIRIFCMSIVICNFLGQFKLMIPYVFLYYCRRISHNFSLTIVGDLKLLYFLLILSYYRFELLSDP